jgi:hypothetical protein
MATPQHRTGRRPAPDNETHDDTMAEADVANGERPEQPESRDHSEYDRRRTDERRGGERSVPPNGGRQP